MTVIVVTGIQAAGKSTIAQALAERLDRSVHLRGDVFRRMIVSGRAEMGPADPPADAIAQLQLRYRLGAMTGRSQPRAAYPRTRNDNFDHCEDGVSRGCQTDGRADAESGRVAEWTW